MSGLPATRPFSVGEYLRLVEVGVLRPDERVELVDGQILAMSPQGPLHSALVARIVGRLVELFPRDEYCVRPQSTLVLAEDEALEPDIAVVAGPCENHERELPRSALLVVEVSDTSLGFDRGARPRSTRGRACPEYWIVDISGGVVEVRRRPSAARYETMRAVQGGDELHPKALEGRSGRTLRAAELLGPEERREQFNAVMRVPALFGRMSDVVDRIESVRGAVAARAQGLGEADAVAVQARALAGKLEDVRKEIVATKEGGAITGEERLREHAANLYGAIMSWEGRPASYQLERIDALSQELDDIQKKLDSLSRATLQRSTRC